MQEAKKKVERGEYSNFLEKIADFSNRAIIAADSKGRIFYWNSSAGEIFGHSALEAIGQHVHTFLPPERILPKCDSCFKTFQESGRKNL